MKVLEGLHFLHRAWRYRLCSERDELAFLLGRDLAGKTVLDVGANRGIYSYWMHKKIGSAGRVIAFEPQPELGDVLRQLKAAFKLRRLEIVNAGLSSSAGEAELTRPKQHWGGASLEWSGSDDVDLLPVRLLTLDDYFAEHDARPVKFIKCDVEGHEYQVFQGGQRLLREDRPELLFECHHALALEEGFFEFLEDLGYQGYFFHQRKLTPLSELEAVCERASQGYFNYVFLPRKVVPHSKVAA
jgi:FkbM family methyltransferase